MTLNQALDASVALVQQLSEAHDERDTASVLALALGRVCTSKRVSYLGSLALVAIAAGDSPAPGLAKCSHIATVDDAENG